MLQEILKRMDNSTQTPPPKVDDTQPAQPAQPVHNAAGQLRAALPKLFDGDQTRGHAFVNSCRLYMTLCPQQFTNDVIRVNWVLSFMKKGRAARFAARALCHETTHGLLLYSSYASFETCILKEFCPQDKAMHAVTVLESQQYFQGRCTMEEYIDDFTDLLPRLVQTNLGREPW